MSSHSFQRRWYRRSQLLTRRPPPGAESWLFDSTSLTARLVRRCRRFRVQLMSQGVRRPTLDERRVLCLPVSSSALVREVRLLCDEVPVVYARTVIPVSTLSGAQRCYANLGTRPLGAMLFADRRMRRDPLMVSWLSPGQVQYPADVRNGEPVWGRRSVFRVAGKPLLVSEFFLPALFESN